MTQSHIRQNLPLKNKVIPVDSDTTFLAHYDLNMSDVLTGIKPVGYPYALKTGNNSCYLRIPNNLKWASTFTISFWIKHGTPQSWSDVLTFDTGVDGTAVRIEKDNTATTYRWYTDGGFVSGTIIFDHDGLQWDHITLVCDGSKVYSYKNGGLVFSGPKHANNLPNCDFINVGRRLTSQYWGGSISRLIMWNTFKTAEQVAEEMVKELKGNEPGLIGYWKLDEGEGTVANDSSKQDNPGVITSPMWTSGIQVATLDSQGYYGSGVRVEPSTTNTWAGDYYIYNNFNVPATIINTGQTYRGMPIWRIGMTVDDAHASALNDFRTNLGSHGVYGGAQTWVENVPYVSSIYWRPVNKLDLVLGGVASNMSGWMSGGNEILNDGWRRFYRYRTGAGVATRADSVHHSIICPSLQLNETVYFEFCGAQTEESRSYPTSYIPSGATREGGKLYYPDTIFDYNIGTFSCWAKTNTAVIEKNIFFQWDTSGGTVSHFGLRMDASGKITFAYGTQTITSAASYNDGQWHFYSVTWESGTSNIFLYVDGVQVGQASAAVTIQNTGGRFGRKIPIGHKGWTYEDGYWNGVIDEIRIDKVARTSDEILAWYYSNSPFWPKGIYKTGY